MNELQLREEICRVGASLYTRGYVHASAGNISVRLADDAGYLITPTDACLGQLDPATLARVDPDGIQRSAPAPPRPSYCTAPSTAPSRRRAA
jgi:ribulose-5-phosphate 4-epimerase/fuculose-1-phosphate aldolase